MNNPLSGCAASPFSRKALLCGKEDATDTANPFANGLIEGAMDIPLETKTRR